MKFIQITALFFCLAMSNLTLTMQVKFHILKSIKKTALLLAVTAYSHKIVTEEKDFTKLPKISLQSLNEYRKEWGKTIDNTKESLGFDQKKSSLWLMIEAMMGQASQLKTPQFNTMPTVEKSPTQSESPKEIDTSSDQKN